MSLLRLFNYLTDGTYARAGDAWHTEANGNLRKTIAHERRVSLRSGEWWAWVEGARENHLVNPLAVNLAPWSPAAPGTTPLVLPDGTSGTPGLINASSAVEQVFDTGSRAAFVSLTGFVRGVGGAQTATISCVNGTPSSGANFPALTSGWTRAVRKGISLVAAGDKSFRLATTVSNQMAAWGCVAESGPSWADARFPSQPVLVNGLREGELFKPGVVTAAMVAKAPTSLSFSFQPDYANTDLVSGNQFTLMYLNTGAAATSIRVWIEGTGAGVCRLRAGFATGTSVETGDITFAEGATLAVKFDNVAGDLTLSGAATGNGSFLSANTYPFVAGMELVVGGDPTLGTNPAFGLVGPLFVEFPSLTTTKIEQLTLNSARLTFSDNVLQFDPRGLHDALNPNNYEVGGTPGFPRVQFVAKGDVASQVVLFFDAPVVQGSLITIITNNIVADPVPVPMVLDANTVQFIGFGTPVLQSQVNNVLIPRVDLANPQTEADAPQGAALGTIPVTETGDLANVSGRAYLKKRVYRRLSTVRSGFMHLVGYGLLPPTKGLFTPTSLRRLQQDVEGQVRAEPGVVSARAKVREIVPGLVGVRLTVQDDNGSFEMTDQLDFRSE